MKPRAGWTLVALAIALALPCASSALAKAPARKKAPQGADARVGPAYARRADVMAEAGDIARRGELDPRWVRRVIGQAHYLPKVAKLVLPPAHGITKNWNAYHARFVESVRIAAGLKFWQENAEALERAQREFGVPAQIIVGIIGVETFYGQQTGNYRVIDALATLAFDFPRSHPRAAQRSAFFKAELEQFLGLYQRSAEDPLAVRGSYAGAMGLPQFMPSSWAKYAVDFDGDGKVDLLRNPSDAIGSVANYFKSFGWQRDMPTHYAVRLTAVGADMATLLEPDIVPTFSAARLSALGAEPDAAGALHKGPLALIELHNGDPEVEGNAPSYVLGTENFYAITRYNWSSYYAMAVIELGRAVAAARGAAAELK